MGKNLNQFPSVYASSHMAVVFVPHTINRLRLKLCYLSMLFVKLLLFFIFFFLLTLFCFLVFFSFFKLSYF